MHGHMKVKCAFRFNWIVLVGLCHAPNGRRVWNQDQTARNSYTNITPTDIIVATHYFSTALSNRMVRKRLTANLLKL